MPGYAVPGKPYPLAGGGTAPSVICGHGRLAGAERGGCAEFFGLLIEGRWHPAWTYELRERRWTLRPRVRKQRQGRQYRPYIERIRGYSERGGTIANPAEAAYVMNRAGGVDHPFPHRRLEQERRIRGVELAVIEPAEVKCGGCDHVRIVDPRRLISP